MKILITDDHQMVRQGLKLILAEEFQSAEFFEANGVDEAISIVEESKPDIVLMDLSMPKRSGFDFLDEIQLRSHRCRTLVVSMYTEVQWVTRAVRAKADGYIVKDGPAEELIRAVTAILQGGKYFDVVAQDCLLEAVVTSSKSIAIPKLSNREDEIMGLITQGKSLAEIGTTLSLAAQTVSTYRQRLLKKLGLKNNAELVRYAIENPPSSEPLMRD